MPNPSSVAMYDEEMLAAEAEIVDAELVPDPPSDLDIVIAAARRHAQRRAHVPGADPAILRACERLEAQQT